MVKFMIAAAMLAIAVPAYADNLLGPYGDQNTGIYTTQMPRYQQIDPYIPPVPQYVTPAPQMPQNPITNDAGEMPPWAMPQAHGLGSSNGSIYGSRPGYR